MKNLSQSQLFYGTNVISTALNHPRFITLKTVFFQENKHSALLTQCRNQNINYKIVSLGCLNNLLGHNKHQGIAAEVEPYQYHTLNEMLKLEPNHNYYRFLILDRIEDPHNFGALIRVAAASAFDAIIVLNRNQAPVSGTVAKAAAGALSLIPICQVTNITAALNELTQKNVWSLATINDPQAVPYHKDAYDYHLALIIGNEGEGISPKLLKKVDKKIVIPMTNTLDSLNASVACGIITNNIYLKTWEDFYSSK